MPKNSIFSLSAKIKIAPSPKLHPSLTTSSTHTHKSSKNFTYGFVLGPLPNPVYKPKHTFDLKNSNFGCAGCAGMPPLKPTKTETSFRKLNSLPTKLRMLFPTHLQARDLCPQTYSLSLLLERSQVTHTPASIKLGGAYKPEKLAFYSTFARQLCDDTHIFQDGPLLFQYTHKHSSPLRPASFAHTNSQLSHSTS